MWQRRRSQESHAKSLMRALWGDCRGRSPPPASPRSGARAFSELGAGLTQPLHPPWWAVSISRWLRERGWHVSLHSFIHSFFHSQSRYGAPALREAASQTKRTLLKGVDCRRSTRRTPSPQVPACTSTVAQLWHHRDASRALSRRASEALRRAGGNGTGPYRTFYIGQ